MSTYPPTQPFLYIIGWSTLDVWYIGVRYKRGCQPSDIWTRYFTSSKYVAKFRAENGEPDHVEVLLTGDKQTVLSVEAEALAAYQLHKDARFLNLNIGGAKFCMSSKTWENETYRAKRVAGIRHDAQQPERNRKLSQTHKRRLQDDKVREKQVAKLAQTVRDPVVQARARQTRKTNDPGFAERFAEIGRNAHKDPAVKARMKEAAKALWANPEHRERMRLAARNRRKHTGL